MVKQPVKDEIATAEKDLDIYAGWIRRLENPDPVLRTESQGKGLKLYDEVDRDAHAGSVLQTRYLSVVGKEWHIVPGKSGIEDGEAVVTPQDEAIADFVREVLRSCNFDQGRQELLQATLYGFYVSEVMWKIENGAVKIAKFIGKHPRRFSFTPERELRLKTSNSMIEGEPVPERKFIVFTYGDSDNPYGKGLGRKLWWPVWFKKHGVKFWLVFLEKFGMPTAVGKYPPGTDPAQQQALLDALDAIQNETGIKIPDSMAIEFMEAKRGGQVHYVTFADFMDRQCSKAVLGQTLTVEVGEKGSYAASKTHEEVRQDILEADAKLSDACMNGSVIRWIVDYNFPGITAYPRLQTNTEAEGDPAIRSQIDERLTTKIGLPVAKKYFYETYGVPEPAEDEELVNTPAAHPINPLFAEYQENPRKQQAQANQQTVEGLADKSIVASRSAMEGLLAPLRETIEQAESMEQLRHTIQDMYTGMDRQKLEELMARAIYMAELYGRLSAKQ
ncbi:MAG: hypothetical protein AVO38_16300 [delta proteobacterium ML8_D]|jgi:phage gp29-like protein|nr:MAG: hypothetical protein AVO38_16300 [delta proteobacterium ML8_D]